MNTSKLRAATYGRGSWESDLPGGNNCNSTPPASGTIAARAYQVTGTISTGGQVLSPSNVTFSSMLLLNFKTENGILVKKLLIQK